MDELTRLASIAAIRELKASYWACADVGDWAGVAATMADDVVWDSRYERRFAQGQPFSELAPVATAIEEGHDAVMVGRDRAVEFMRRSTAPFVMFHMGGAPIIEIESDDHASAIWPFFDHLNRSGEVFRGYGHYHERYRRVDGQWLISSIRMTRIGRDADYGDYPIQHGSRKS